MPESKILKLLLNRVSLLALFFCLISSSAFAANSAPAVGTITPSSGSGQTNIQQIFSTTYSDPDGWANIQYVYFLINTSTSTSTCPYLKYDQNVNKLYVRDDTNTTWLGGFAPGSANVIENKYVKLDCALSSATGSGTTMTVSWAVTIKPLFIGTKNTYLYVKDDANASAGYTKVGTWAIPNQPPVIKSINPTSGTSNPNEAVTFTTVCSDLDTWQHIQYIYLIVNTSASGTNSFEGYYNQNTNLLYLRNDANSAWLGGFVPGSSNIIENSYCALDCSQTTVTGSGNDMAVVWKVTFKSLFAGAKKTYLYVKDDANAYAGWTQVGSWTIVNHPPQAVSITPASGQANPDQTVNFVTIGSDPDGWQQIKYIYFLVNTSTSTSSCPYAYYDQTTNKLYLRNDANSAWLGGYAPASANIIENSYCKIDCSQTTVLGTGNNLTINWNIAFKAPSGGTKNTYLNVTDRPGLSTGLTKLGTWTVTNQPPTIGTITPASGTGQANVAQAFATTYSDPDGWQNIQYVYLLINTSTSTSTCPYFYYNQNTNLLYIRNDANTAWLGGYAPGSASVIENAYAKLNCAATTVTGSGPNMTVNWSVTIKSLFTGTKNTYLYAKDDANVSAGYTQVGTWTIPNNTPSVGTITPASGTSIPDQSVNFATTYSDLDTWLNIQYVYLLMNTSASGLKCFYGYYNQNTNKLYLRNDANTAWVGGYAPGTAYVIENSYAKLDCAATVVSGLGNDLTINWAATFKQAFAGTKNCYLYVKDDSNAYQGYIKKGTWSIQSDTTPPTISINSVLSPTNQSVTLSYFVSDNITPTEQIVVTGDQSPYTSEGSHNITLTAKDLAGNIATASVNFTIDKTAPVIIITSPQNGSVVEDSPVQLQGTVDGVAFSESRSLNPGENTLTKNATDAAGNSASASISVYMYTGELIGPEGGVVSSQDGKVKITIPQGALTTPTRIRISRVNNDNLEGATPSGKSLLSVVECKPYGLVFNKPVEITYSLDHAEIPGTPVELDLYDSVQNTLISTGQTTTVPADGYTISFSLIHFSTYAALKSLTPQSIPIGSGVKIPLPDLLTGSFSHSIPIIVPPGRKGIQPSLGLSYRSSGANSWVGMGLSLNPGYIVRSTRLGPPTYNDVQDTFYFITDAGTTELVNLIDNLYQAKVESGFTKFFKETDDSWRAVAKDGTIVRLGQDSNSKETSSSGTFAWYVTKTIDTNGNYVEYHYTKDQGKAYLSSIDYTGNESGVSPANHIEFYLESRSDISSSYISTSKIATTKRLKEIQVKVGYDLVWRYVLEYTNSPDTDRSLLRLITQYGSDNKTMPVQTLTYQQAK